MNLRKTITVFGSAFLFFFLFTYLTPVTDPVESNYVLTAKEMVLTSDWISPRIYGQVWFDKPVMFYWLLAAAFKLVGISQAAARLIPCFFGAVGITLTACFVTAIATFRQGIIAAAMLSTFFQFFMISKLIITDMVLFVFTSAALACFFLGYCEVKGTKRWYMLMYPCLALAVLTKGPVGLVLPGIIILLFLAFRQKWSEWSKMHLLSGTIVFLLIALPWYVIMYFQHGEEFLRTFFGVHNYLRATVSEHPKDNVFYYYLVVFVLSTLPWTGFAAAGLYHGFKNARHDEKSAFMVIWAAAFLVFYSLMATKYLTYTFPMLFPVAVLAAEWIDKAQALDHKRQLYFAGGPFALLGTAIVGASFKYIEGVWLATFLSIPVSILLGIGLWHVSRGHASKAFLKGACYVASCYVLAAGVLFPAIADSRSGTELADLLVPFDHYKIGMYQEYSTSAVFYSGKVLVRIEPQEHDGSLDTEGLSWSAKNTMPIQSLDKFVKQAGETNLLLVVPRDKIQAFEREANYIKFEQVKSTASFILYTLSGS